ncbi:hypothetical protein CLV35_3520 [Motilibacter peucedani]|uniref:Uncharacterized protein n=1 Tax=Motilibacter peucedani TaxID=598650 RepID=A0A420XLC0_9ACTN|nr:hypothetical protein [Motilibacter peucedani]RKS69343.1 hypothetical protein CLV35_3520 [Motilibacter peucedani]
MDLYPAGVTAEEQAYLDAVDAWTAESVTGRVACSCWWRTYDVVRYTRMRRGGHSAAHEEPELLAEDIRQFFSGARRGLWTDRGVVGPDA